VHNPVLAAIASRPTRNTVLLQDSKLRTLSVHTSPPPTQVSLGCRLSHQLFLIVSFLGLHFAWKRVSFWICLLAFIRDISFWETHFRSLRVLWAECLVRILFCAIGRGLVTTCTREARVKWALVGNKEVERRELSYIGVMIMLKSLLK
jgi:hypothetical protein